MERITKDVCDYAKRLLVATMCMFCFVTAVPPAILMFLLIVPPLLGVRTPVLMWHLSEDASWNLIAAVQGGALIIALIGFLAWMARETSAVASPSLRRGYRTATIAYAVLLSYGLIVSATNLFGPQYGRCEFYNSPTTLNAGRKDFNGVTYEIRICGSNPRPQDGDNDRLELSVLDEHGETLARRHYSVNWQAGISFHEPLQFEEEALIAPNAFGPDIRITIPPSRFDWVRARIPLLD